MARNWTAGEGKMLPLPVLLRHRGREVLLLAGLNTIIALLLDSLGFGGGFAKNLLYSQIIGFAAFLTMRTGYGWYGAFSPLPRFFALAALLALGVGVGVTAAALFTGGVGDLLARPGFFLRVFGYGILLGAGVSSIFFMRKEAAAAREAFQEERIERLTREKEVTEMRLRLLQAQVEPHFLFNTLATIASLVEGAPEQARTMLHGLADFLRSGLAALRETGSTVGSELALVENYLRIHQVRMGERLRYSIVCPEEARDLAMPPFLVQPLVENSIRHGLEPLPAGGEVTVRVEKAETMLRIAVEDTGAGMGPSPGAGVGLASIRERLAGLYGDAARLRLADNRPAGVLAVLELPYER